MAEMTREQHADTILRRSMAQADALVEVAKLAVIAADGGKANALYQISEGIAGSKLANQDLCRFIAVILVDRAVKELDAE